MWLEREMVGWFPAGRADVTAFLAGEELPSVIARREEKAAGIERLADMSREMADAAG